MSGAVESVWEALACVSRFRMRSRDASADDVSTIEGAVIVTVTPDEIRFTERGELTTPGGRRLATRNAIVWVRDDDAIEVSHERFGADHAVALVRLRETGDALRSDADHLCGDDRYACAVAQRDGGVEVVWTITGPRTRMTVATVYS